MSVKSAHQKNAQRSMIYLTFFLLLSIPLILFGLAQDDFDLRREAFQDLELSEEYPCLISLPNVNPYSLEVDKTVTVQVEAFLKGQGISRLEIFDSEEEIVYEELFEESPVEMTTSFPFTPKESGKVSLSGVIETLQGRRVQCEITSEYGIQGLRAVANNTAPEFTTNPSDSVPSQNIVTGDMYEYTLKAMDVDGDRINYAYSFTPRADWLNLTVIDDGSDGRLTLKFAGSTQKAASYLANVFIHDGYSKNLRSQSWVINVSPSENDIPVVTIMEPERGIRVDRGSTFRTSWEATDLNHIVGYELFITNNLANEEVWIEIDGDIPYDETSYNVDTSDLTPGTYKIIATATDNQQPPATGKGVSPEIVVTTVTDEETDTDDSVVIEQPQVTNMAPLSTDEITNRRVTIRATIVASRDAQIEEDTIVFKLNERDISDDIKINRISQKEFSLIYQPDRDLDEGLQKAQVTFSDTRGLEADQSWNFTIQPSEIISDDIYNIFGYEVARNVVHIVAVGIITVILALVTPFIIFSIWKDDKDDPKKQVNSKLPPSTPLDTLEYIEDIEVDDSKRIREKIESEPKEEKDEVEDAWNMYSAPKPVVTEEQKERDLKELKEEKEEQVQKEEKTEKEADIEPEEKVEERKEEVQTPPPTPPTTPPSTPPTTPPPTPSAQPPPEEEKAQQSTEQQPPQPEEQPDAPDIPEPEIPEISDLEKISQQLQEIKKQEQDS